MITDPLRETTAQIEEALAACPAHAVPPRNAPPLSALELPYMEALDAVWSVRPDRERTAIVAEAKGAVVNGRAYCVEAVMHETPFRVEIRTATGMTGRTTNSKRLYDALTESLTIAFASYSARHRSEIDYAHEHLTTIRAHMLAERAAMELRGALMTIQHMNTLAAELSLAAPERSTFRTLRATNPDEDSNDLAAAVVALRR